METSAELLGVSAALLVYLTFLVLVYMADFYGPIKMDQKTTAPTFYMHFRYKKKRDQNRLSYFRRKAQIQYLYSPDY